MKKIFFSILLLSACGREAPVTAIRAGEAPSLSSHIELAEITSGDCLSLPTYLDRIRSLGPRPALELSTDFNLRSPKPLRENFRRMMAYGSFAYRTTSLEELPDFPRMLQRGCETISLPQSDGSNEEYEIASFTAEKLTATASEGKALEYEWLGPQLLRATWAYPVLDLPCGSERDVIILRVSKVIDWSDQATAEADALPAPVDTAFLQLLAEAIGVEAPTLFDESGQILAPRLRKVAELPPLDETRACRSLPRTPMHELQRKLAIWMARSFPARD